MTRESERPPGADLRSRLVAELTGAAVPTALLTAKAHVLLTLLRDAVETRVYLAEVFTYEVGADHHRALVLVRVVDRALTVARTRATRRAASLAGYGDVARALRLTPVLRRIAELDTGLEADLLRVRHEAQITADFLAPPPTAEETPSPPNVSAPQPAPAPEPADFPPAHATTPAVARARETVRNAEDAFRRVDFSMAAALRVEREARETLEDTIAGLLDDGGGMDRALDGQDERITAATTRLDDLRDEAGDLSRRLAAALASHRTAAALVQPCAEHGHVVQGRALDDALSSTLQLLPDVLRSSRQRAQLADVFARSLMLAASIDQDAELRAAPPPDLPASLDAWAASLPSCQGRWARSAATALAGPLGRVSSLCLAAEAGESALAGTLRARALTGGPAGRTA